MPNESREESIPSLHLTAAGISQVGVLPLSQFVVACPRGRK